MAEKSTQNVQYLLGAIGGVALLVAAIGIMNTMMMSIFERTKEIGIIKVLGCRIDNMRTSLDKMAAGITPVIDTIFQVEDLERGVERLESRKVFGKLLVAF